MADTTTVPCRRRHSRFLPRVTAACLVLVVCSCLRVTSALNTCAGGQCIDAADKVKATSFFDAYPDYDPPEVGYELPTTLFRFFIAIISIILACWAIFFAIQARGVYILAHGLFRGRVLRVPAIYASMRHSITRDVIASWMQRHEAPIPPAKVMQMQIQVHFPMANAKLCVNPASLPISSPNALASPSAGSPSSPLASEYTLKMTVSTLPGHACLVEVWFGVPLKTVALFLSDYAKFKSRHGSSGHTGGAMTKLKSPTAAGAPASNGKRGSNKAVADHASSPVSPLRMVPSRDPEVQAFASSPGQNGGNHHRATSPQRPNTEDSPPVSPHRGVSSRSSRISPHLHIQTHHASAALPGSAPSREHSPSHVTAEEERSKHLSQLSLREERERGSVSTRPYSAAGSVAGNNMYATNLLTAALGTGNVLGLTPGQQYTSGTPASPSPDPSNSSRRCPSTSPAAPSASAAQPLQPLFTLAPAEGTGLFREKEAMFTLPPALYPSGTKQQVHVSFPAVHLRSVLDHPNLCPMLIFLTGVDESQAMQLGGQHQMGGELTIVQFAPPPTSTKKDGSKSPAPISAPRDALPAPAITAQVSPDPDETEGAGAAAEGGAGEKEEEGAAGEIEMQPLSPSSPTTAGLQDAITSRVKFDRQLILAQDEAYEMEELYGMDEADAECIIWSGETVRRFRSEDKPPQCEQELIDILFLAFSPVLRFSLTEIREVILLPCKHVCACSGCFKPLTKWSVLAASWRAHASCSSTSCRLMFLFSSSFVLVVQSDLPRSHPLAHDVHRSEVDRQAHTTGRSTRDGVDTLSRAPCLILTTYI